MSIVRLLTPFALAACFALPATAQDNPDCFLGVLPEFLQDREPLEGPPVWHFAIIRTAWEDAPDGNGKAAPLDLQNYSMFAITDQAKTAMSISAYFYGEEASAQAYARCLESPSEFSMCAKEPAAYTSVYTGFQECDSGRGAFFVTEEQEILTTWWSGYDMWPTETEIQRIVGDMDDPTAAEEMFGKFGYIYDINAEEREKLPEFLTFKPLSAEQCAALSSLPIVSETRLLRAQYDY